MVDCSDPYATITTIWQAPAPLNVSVATEAPLSREAEQDVMTEEDWQKILPCAVLTTYKEGDIILRQGESSRKVYQIVSGICRVEKWDNNQTQILGRMKAGQMFGEITYFFGGGASVTIIAEEDDMQVCKLEQLAYLQGVCNAKEYPPQCIGTSATTSWKVLSNVSSPAE